MRKLYSLALLFVASAFCYVANGFTGIEDVTSKYLTNADFSADKPVANTVITYAKDMADNGAGSDGVGLYGMQPVSGWTASNPTDNIKHTDATEMDAKASGIFPFYDPATFEEMDETLLYGLGGAYYCLSADKTQGLGFVSVWGNTATYSQDVTLPAGSYIIVANVYNAGGTGTITNRIGFVSDSQSFLSDSATYQEKVWEDDTIYVELAEETAGQITLGMTFGAGSGAAPHVFVSGIKIWTVDPNEAEAAKIAAAKEELLGLINIGKAYNVSTTVSEAVYNDPDATLEAVQIAIENQKELNAAGVTDLSAYFIVNSHFDLDEPLEGGICTYDYDCEKNGIPLTNYSMLPLTGWERTKTDNGAASGVYGIGSGAFLGGKDYVVPTVMSDGSSEGLVLGFVTCWTMAVQYKQGVTLPAGDYTLTMSYYNTGGTDAIEKNLIGFVADDGTEYLSTKTTFPVAEWTKDEIKFTLEEETTGYFSLGYKSVNKGSAAMPHFFTDGISLMYVGSGIDPSMFALKAAVSGANKIINEQFYTVLQDSLQDAIDEGQELIDAGSTDADANKAAYEKLTSLTLAANTNITAYQKLDVFYNEGGDYDKAVNRYTEDVYPKLADELATMGDNIFDALNEYSWSSEDIYNTINSLPTMIKEGVQEAWDNAVESGEVPEAGIDISVLFTGLGADGDYAGWTSTKGSVSVQYNVAEIYNNTPFKASKTLADLPAGKYTVTTHGFYRIADNATNYDAYVAGGVTGGYVFAGPNKSDLTNVAAVTFTSSDEFTGLAETTTGSGVFVVNNREGAQKLFDSEEYGETFKASASTVLTTTEDLVFGTTADELQEANWTTWYEFSVVYNAASEEDLSAEMTAQANVLSAALEELSAYKDEKIDVMTNPMEEVVNTFIDEKSTLVDEILSGAYESVKGITLAKEAIVQTDSISTLAKANVAAVDTCIGAISALDEAINNPELHPSQKALAAAAAILDEATDDNIANMTTAEVEAFVVRINDAITALKIPAEAETASDDNPCDMTSLIVNADIEQGATVGWQYTKNGGNGPALEKGINGKSVEFWRDPAAELRFNFWQTLSGLPAGTYTLTVDASNSLNGQEDTGALGRAFLYAATFTPVEGETADSTFFSSDAVEVQEEACTEKWATKEVTFTLAEGEKVAIGVKSSGTMAARWFVCDDFTLTYYGKNSAKEPSDDPMAVEGIEAAESVKADGKYIENNQVVIYRNGIKYNTAGQMIQ